MAGIVPPGAFARGRSGAVYVLTNQATGNSVMVYRRAPDGILSYSGTFSTGGKGMGTGADPLGSQGALTLGPGRRLLFAVNAGSNEISEFAVRGRKLYLLDKVSSHGVMPVSIAVHGWLVYVLNAGGTPNIKGFIIDPFTNRLISLPGSRRKLAGGSGAAPAEVGFSRDGSTLAVTEKGTSKIDTYAVNDFGFARALGSNASNGTTPFGFAFLHRDFLLVSEAGPNALSSYQVDPNGKLDLISGSVPNGQTATCWVVVTDDGRYAYTASAGTAAISSYSVTRDGILSLIDPAAEVTGNGSAPTDLALSRDSRFLYVRDGGSDSVSAFRVESNGSLVAIGSVSGIPAGAQGIAAR
ncbi:MAG TPA: beta-propeller fold lactonase family protein [Terriglobia bacterium]|nr:beta-propeller fold lactonase family protein [Terriglobia bacterium]